MKKSLFVLISTAFALASCGGAKPVSSLPSESESEPSHAVTWATPTGAPTLAFYDQGNNANWLSTDTPAAIMPSAFAGNSYDALVFDGMAGLKLIRANKATSQYVMARWVNELPFYLVSVKHTADETILPSATIDAFVQNGNASVALNKLASDENAWNIGTLTAVTYEDGVTAVNQHLQAAPNSFDYFVLAEPVYTLAKGALSTKGITLNLIKDLQSDWSTYYDGAKIPAAALFLNKRSLETYPNAMTSFLADYDARINSLVTTPEIAQSALRSYIDAGNDIAARFGIQENIVNILPTLQASNKLAFQNVSWTGESLRDYANGFAAVTGVASYDSSFFIA